MQENRAAGGVERPVARPEARPGEHALLGQLLLDARHGERLRKHVAERRQRDEERHHARREDALAPDVFEELGCDDGLGLGDVFFGHGGKLKGGGGGAGAG